MNKQIDMMLPLAIIDRSKEVSQLCYDKGKNFTFKSKEKSFLSAFVTVDTDFRKFQYFQPPVKMIASEVGNSPNAITRRIRR